MTDSKPHCRRFLLVPLVLATLHVLLAPPVGGDQGLPALLPDARLRQLPATLRAVAIDDDTLAVGSFDFDFTPQGAGSVKIYRRTAGSWRLETTLAPPPGPPDGAGFGLSIAVSGDTLVVGAPSLPGKVYVYVRGDGAWTEQSVLAAPAVDAPDLFGAQVAISGDRIVVGAPSAAFSQRTGGFAFAYARIGGSWHLDGIFFGEANSYGSNVALAGNQMAIGGDGIDILVRNRHVWRRQSRVEGAFGPVVISGNTLAAASLGEDVSVWVLNDGSSKLQARIPAKPAFGNRPVLALDGDTLVVTTTTGEVLVYVRRRGSWNARAQLQPPTSNLDFGRALALSGSTAAVASRAPVWIFEGIP